MEVPFPELGLLARTCWFMATRDGIRAGKRTFVTRVPGAEALGRGGAFTAKADSPLALEYNVAGLAQLGGTQVLLDGQLWLPSGGQCLDVRNHNQRPCYGGLAAVTTDFGVLRRWTFALGFRLPEPVNAYGIPSLVSSFDPGAYFLPPWPPALLVAPSLAVGVQAHRRLALGLLVEDAMAFSLSPCPLSSYPSGVAGCSGPQVVNRSLMNPVVQLGLLGNLGTMRSSVMLAASVRSAPNLGLAPILDAPQRFSLPWTFRAGARYLRRDGFTGRPYLRRRAGRRCPAMDGRRLAKHPSAGTFYARSSVGLRLGGSYHVLLPHATLIGRLGFLFDRTLPAPDQVIA